MPTGEDNLLALTQWVGAVGTLGQLYAKFPAGGLYGMFGLVTGRNKFAAWNIDTRQWEFTDNTVDTFPDNFITAEPILGLPANTDISGITAVELLSLISKLRTRVSTISELVKAATWTVDEVLYIPYEVIITVDGDTKANNGTYYLALGKDYTAIEDWVKTSVAGSDTFTSDFIANPAFGRYAAGQNVPATGMDFQELILDAFNDYLKPILSNMNTTGLATLVECGTTVGGNISFTFSISNGSNLQANSLSVQDISAGIALVENQPVVSPVIASTGNIKRTINGGYNTWQLRAMSSRGDAIMSNQFTTVWRLKTFHGAVDSTPSTSAHIRALAAEWDTVKTISININKPKYLIALRNGITIKKVITESYEDITAEFVQVAQINVVLADGTTTATYNVMEYSKPGALGATATITLN